MAGADQMRQYTERYDALKAELQSLGFLFQGSLQTRRIACGKTTCRCYHDPDARHGPYHYWTRKARGKTVGMRLTEDELILYQEWIENNRSAGESHHPHHRGGGFPGFNPLYVPGRQRGGGRPRVS